MRMRLVSNKSWCWLLLNLWLLLALCLPEISSGIVVAAFQAEEQGQQSDTTTNDEEKKEGGGEPVDALLFPFFVLALGILSYILLSRKARWLPYTACMFVLGTIIGAAVRKLSDNNLLDDSIQHFWLSIDPELLLVAFLPGLIYNDASSQNTHLFRVAFSQCLVTAFPMVLAGTTLTALVAYYIFPYGWSFNLCMTFGSILAATDPVAVAALLDQVGAPPRLKVHIAGESLLNDGSAIVFFTIFSQLFFLELGEPGVGQDLDGPEGIKLFFRMSFGGFSVGVLFGLGLLYILHRLGRRLDREENVTQVGATITVAYLCYFTADVVWGTSGVIAVVTLGVMVAAFGTVYINDVKLMEDFWQIVEWLLNTVLFTLGGLVFGEVISNADPDKYGQSFEARDWGYLVVLYILLTAIRFGLFVVFFPITKCIGLGSNWKELIFQSYGGLRGAVGISLAIVLDNTVKKNSDGSQLDNHLAQQTNKVFGMVGGIALLTLCINGVFAGPLLHYLGLSDTSDTRERMLKCYRGKYRENAICTFVDLLGQRRFKKVSFSVIRHHVPFLRDLTRDEVLQAACQAYVVKQVTESLNEEELNDMVNLDGVLMYLDKIIDNSRIKNIESLVRPNHSLSQVFLAKDQSRGSYAPGLRSSSVMPEDHAENGGDPRLRPTGMRFMASGPSMAQILRGSKSGDMSLAELRRLFLELVRAAYNKQISDGELVDREFVFLSLIESLEMAAESCEREGRLNDFDYIFLVGYPHTAMTKFIRNRAARNMCLKKEASSSKWCPFLRDADSIQIKLDIEKCLAFILAHTTAQDTMRNEFSDDVQLDLIDEKIIQESEQEVKLAEAYMNRFDKNEVELVISHKVCKILLNNTVQFLESLADSGLMKEREVEEAFEEIQKSLWHLDMCAMKKHPGEDMAGSTEALTPHHLHKSEAAAYLVDQGVRKHSPVTSGQPPPHPTTIVEEDVDTDKEPGVAGAGPVDDDMSFHRVGVKTGADDGYGPDKSHETTKTTEETSSS